MSEHPAVAFLRQAHARAEELARAATPDPWTVHPYDWTSSFDASIGHYFEADVVGGGHEGGGVVDMADAEFIAANSPAAVLRRITAGRAILAEHRLVKTQGYDGHGAAVFDACRVCGRGGYTPGPCRTVLLLAEAWGWTEGT